MPDSNCRAWNTSPENRYRRPVLTPSSFVALREPSIYLIAGVDYIHCILRTNVISPKIFFEHRRQSRATHAFDTTMNHSIIASVLTVTIFTDDSSLLMQISRLSRTLRFTKDFWLQKSETMSTKLVSQIHPRTYLILLVKKKYSNIYSSHSKLISSGNSLLQFIDTYRYTPYSSTLQHFIGENVTRSSKNMQVSKAFSTQVLILPETPNHSSKQYPQVS